jgi:hypothetical protein
MTMHIYTRRDVCPTCQSDSEVPIHAVSTRGENVERVVSAVRRSINPACEEHKGEPLQKSPTGSA